jgi:hypothetical protein
VTLAETYVNDEMRAALGTELGRQVSFPIGESDIRRWAVAVYYPEQPPRLFWDAEYAATTVHRGIVAPEEFNPFAWMVAEPQGVVRPADYDPNTIEISLGISPPPTRFQLNGGLDVTYGVRMRPGDVITSVSSLHSYEEHRGRLGLMLFTTMANVWTNQRGEQVRLSKGTVIRY